jgi:outer membrane protein
MALPRSLRSFCLLGLALASQATCAQAPVRARQAYPWRSNGTTRVSDRWDVPRLEPEPEPAPTETLAQALDAAYRSAPSLEAQRFDLRATDEDYAQALAALRPSAQLEVTGGYTKTVPGRTTQAQRSLADRLGSPIITANSLAAQLSVDQPVYTGGRASADADVARAAILSGRAQLRATEGDLLLRVITAYVSVRQDARALALRRASVTQLQATLAEVQARREAGELTRTDIAQAATQLEAAIATANVTEQQLQQDRATFAALVGKDPGVLAPEPPMPQLPETIDAAFDLAQRLNPELAEALAAERASRERISAAAAQGRPTVSLRGTARLGGQAAPYYLRNEDQEFAGQAVLTIPLSQGGRVRSLVEQAQDRNAADRARIEQARRDMIQSVVDAWNAMATAQRNLAVQQAQVDAASVLDDGTFQEYRAGLRSTFDVLYAHGALRDAEISVVATQRDLYVAQATLLRRIGVLEARSILTQTPLYDPAVNTRAAAARNVLPLNRVVRGLDRIGKPDPKIKGLERPALPLGTPNLIQAAPSPEASLVTSPDLPPIGGTIGYPASPR